MVIADDARLSNISPLSSSCVVVERGTLEGPA